MGRLKHVTEFLFLEFLCSLECELHLFGTSSGFWSRWLVLYHIILAFAPVVSLTQNRRKGT